MFHGFKKEGRNGRHRRYLSHCLVNTRLISLHGCASSEIANNFTIKKIIDNRCIQLLKIPKLISVNSQNSLFLFSQISPYEVRKRKKESWPNWRGWNFSLEEGFEETDSTMTVSRQLPLVLLVTVGSNFQVKTLRYPTKEYKNPVKIFRTLHSLAIRKFEKSFQKLRQKHDISH